MVDVTVRPPLKIFQSGNTPEYWKKVDVTPIFKRGRMEDQRNYRAVSLTLIPRNVMEQIILEAIGTHEEGDKSRQQGFKKEICLINLITFCDKMTGLVDKERVVNTLHIDFSNPFDRDAHSILINKLTKQKLD